MEGRGLACAPFENDIAEQSSKTGIIGQSFLEYVKRFSCPCNHAIDAFVRYEDAAADIRRQLAQDARTPFRLRNAHELVKRNMKEWGGICHADVIAASEEPNPADGTVKARTRNGFRRHQALANCSRMAVGNKTARARAGMRFAMARQQEECIMSNLHGVTGHQPVEPDHGPEQGPEIPKGEPGPNGAPLRKHHDPEEPGSDEIE
jgi:hypothetical protein